MMWKSRPLHNFIFKCSLMQGLRENGVEKSRPLGEKFDPNLHEALFEMPDPSKEPGTIGAVTKVSHPPPHHSPPKLLQALSVFSTDISLHWIK
jgi:hypothetical protein